MRKIKSIVNKNPNELAKSLGLTRTDAIEWEVRYKITKKIIESAKNSGISVTTLAKASGTSRGRITKILKEDNYGISLDVLVRVLATLGETIQIKFKKAA